MTSESTPRLVLHIGIGKTGSSALQVAFVRARGKLARLGVNYPEHSSDAAARSGKVVSGNGMGIVEAFAPRTHVPEEEQRARTEILQETCNRSFRTTVYSSELLYSFTPSYVDRTKRELAQQGARLQVIVYVRNIAGHAVSSYSQAVKRRMFTGTMREYIDRKAGGTYRLNLHRKLEALRNLLDPEGLRVLHYDSVRHDLVPHFFREILGVDPSGLVPGVVENINRSLTWREVELMRYMNKSLRTWKQAQLLSDVLIDRPPLANERPTIRSEDLELLREVFEPEVGWINDTFFPDTRPLAVEASDVRVADEREQSLTLSEVERFLLDCLVDVTRRHAAEGVAEPWSSE